MILCVNFIKPISKKIYIMKNITKNNLFFYRGLGTIYILVTMIFLLYNLLIIKCSGEIEHPCHTPEV